MNPPSSTSLPAPPFAVAALAAGLPHSGLMRLLASVDMLSDEHIVCSAQAHELAAHPLSIDGQLPKSALIEYGAQAAAVHRACQCWPALPGTGGMLVSVGEVRFADDPPAHPLHLRVEARCETHNDAARQYGFIVWHGEKALARGQLTVTTGNP